jgi:hypothetical protein
MKSIHESINRLPELPLEPFEVAGKLAHADRGPFLTIKKVRALAGDRHRAGIVH